jgi:YebC/PmpR family DNA-binding regulatory protein
MSGHSKWATIKRKKGAADAKRGQVFTRLTREIVMAARDGGADVDSNFRLRLAVEKAREQNMPKDNIERAMKRGSGEGKDGVVYEQMYYEGYGPHGVPMMIECVTENRNRTVAEVRHLLNRFGGTLGEAGSVGWQFKRVAYFALSASKTNFDAVFEVAVEGGAEDVTQDEDLIEVLAPVESFKVLSDALRAAKIPMEEAELRMIPTNEIELSVEQTLQVLRMIETIEELDDVQYVFHAMHLTDEAMAALENEA